MLRSLRASHGALRGQLREIRFCQTVYLTNARDMLGPFLFWTDGGQDISLWMCGH